MNKPDFSKVTPAPWRNDMWSIRLIGSSQHVYCNDRINGWDEESVANAEFIAWARNNIERLLKIEEEAKNLIDAMNSETGWTYDKIQRLQEALEEI